MDEIVMRPVARIHTDFPTKFGVPRQSGLVPELRARVVFEPGYRAAEAVRGLEGFSHIWLLWYFSASARTEGFSPTVRPPRLGGNVRVGVFATRSPFRPNGIGLSCVRLLDIDCDAADGPALIVGGADLMDGTPILDVKPYVLYADAHPEAEEGFTSAAARTAEVIFPPEKLALVPEDRREALLGVLAQDPRPSYQDDPERVYGFGFAGLEIRFRVAEGLLTVLDVSPTDNLQ